MAYRGEDLDLRTAQTGTAFAGDGAGVASGEPGIRDKRAGVAARRVPIWVDEAVLACCQHAHEVATAHRAGEVRPEHLLYALTRIDTAIDALEARGVRVSALRRDCAAVIAGDIAADLAPGGAEPRRSEELEHILRRAAALAHRYNGGPARVDHVLDALIEARTEIVGANLLLRHGLRAGRETGEALPPSGRIGFAPQDTPLTLHRPWAEGNGDGRQAAKHAMAHAAGNGDGNGLDASGTIAELQREVLAQREDVNGLAAAMHDKLQALEHVVATQRPAGLGPELIGRLQALERLLQAKAASPAPDLGAFEARLAALEAAVAEGAAAGARSWGEAAQKIAGLASGLANLPQSAPDLTAINGRLDIIEEAVLSAAGEGAPQLSDRLRAVEEAVTVQREQAFEATAAVIADIKAVAGAIANQQAHAERAQASVNERVQILAAALDRQRGDLNANLAQPLLGRVDAMAGRLREAGGELSRRLAAIEGAVAERAQGYAKELTEVHEALVRISGHQHALGGTLDASRQESAGVRDAMATVAGRIEALEREAGRSLFVLEALASRLEGMHRVTVERHHRRNRLWYWLFGTDDWVAASWPSQAARIEADRRAAIGTVRN